MEHGCHVELVAALQHSIADVNLASLPQGPVRLVRPVNDFAVLGNPHRELGLELLRHVDKCELPRILAAEGILRRAATEPRVES